MSRFIPFLLLIPFFAGCDVQYIPTSKLALHHPAPTQLNDTDTLGGATTANTPYMGFALSKQPSPDTLILFIPSPPPAHRPASITSDHFTDAYVMSDASLAHFLDRGASLHPPTDLHIHPLTGTASFEWTDAKDHDGKLPDEPDQITFDFIDPKDPTFHLQGKFYYKKRLGVAPNAMWLFVPLFEGIPVLTQRFLNSLHPRPLSNQSDHK